MSRFYNNGIYGGDELDDRPLDNVEIESTGEEPSLSDKIKKFWKSLPLWLRILIICVAFLLIVAIIVVVVWKLKKEKFGTRVVKPKTSKSKVKEGFVMVNDINQNSYVNSYIESTRGNLVSPEQRSEKLAKLAREETAAQQVEQTDLAATTQQVDQVA